MNLFVIPTLSSCCNNPTARPRRNDSARQGSAGGQARAAEDFTFQPANPPAFLAGSTGLDCLDLRMARPLHDSRRLQAIVLS